MITNTDRALAPRSLATAADWVVAYAASGPELLAERGSAAGSPLWSATADGLDVRFTGVLFDLEQLAVRFGVSPGADRNPARLILEAYRRLGEKCLDGTTGRFALLIAERADRSTNRLLAVRDQMGLHPLFYAAAGNRVLFSNSIDALLAEPDVSRDLNRVVLAERLMHRSVDPNETHFSSVRRVLPGHLLELTGRAQTLRAHWDPGAEREWTDEEAASQFEAVFERAVDRCVGRGRSAIFLSGGFDSVSIAATATAMARQGGRPAPHAVSLGFSDPGCDEQFIQRSVAQSLGLTQEFVPFDAAVNGRGLLMPALELGATWPSPLLNIWSPAYLDLARRARRQGCDTILTGTGGDEWLNVTPCLAADLIRQGEWRQLVTFMAVLKRSFRFSALEVARSTLWTFGLRRLIGGAADRIAPSLWQAQRRRREIGKTPAWVAPDRALRREMDERVDRVLPPARPGKGGFYDHELRIALTHPLVNMEFEEHFEFGRRVGASMLHPYLDADLVKLLYGMSPLSLTSGGRTKGLVRGAVARRFPQLGFERHRKVDASGFFRSTLQREGPAAWSANGGVKRLSELGVFQSSRFEPVLAEIFAGRRPRDNYLIWTVMNLESWVRPRVTSGAGVCS